jgi:hypothetical protein
MKGTVDVFNGERDAIDAAVADARTHERGPQPLRPLVVLLQPKRDPRPLPWLPDRGRAGDCGELGFCDGEVDR